MFRLNKQRVGKRSLVTVNADPYLYPMILSGIIFVAVLLVTTRDRVPQGLLRRLQ